MIANGQQRVEFVWVSSWVNVQNGTFELSIRSLILASCNRVVQVLKMPGLNSNGTWQILQSRKRHETEPLVRKSTTHTCRLPEFSTPTSSAPAQGACGIPHTPSKDLPKSLVLWGTALASEWEDPVAGLNVIAHFAGLIVSTSVHNVHLLSVGPWT